MFRSLSDRPSWIERFLWPETDRAWRMMNINYNQAQQHLAEEAAMATYVKEVQAWKIQACKDCGFTHKQDISLPQWVKEGLANHTIWQALYQNDETVTFVKTDNNGHHTGALGDYVVLDAGKLYIHPKEKFERNFKKKQTGTMRGRVDLEAYRESAKTMHNFIFKDIAAPRPGLIDALVKSAESVQYTSELLSMFTVANITKLTEAMQWHDLDVVQQLTTGAWVLFITKPDGTNEVWDSARLEKFRKDDYAANKKTANPIAMYAIRDFLDKKNNPVAYAV